jgi:hypothetical protein
MTPGTRRIPDALLDRYLADDLRVEAKARLEATLASSPADQARLAELRADSAAFLVQHPPRILVERFHEKQRRTKVWRWPALRTPELAVVAVVVLVLLTFANWPRDPQRGTTAKGLVFAMYRKVSESSAQVAAGETLAPGDSVGFVVKADKSGFVAVLSKDAKDTVSVYYPYGGAKAAPYDVSQLQLPVAIALDDTLGREDVYALYSTQPFELGWAVQALKSGQPLGKVAPKEVVVVTSYFLKQPRANLQK